MKYYLVKVKYDGKGFYGIVPQPGLKTVIGEILSFFEIKKFRLYVVSRTDKGVSAEENYFVLGTEKEIEWEEFNHEKIKILKVFELKNLINIRKFSTGKLYYYYLPKTLFDEKYIYKPKYIVIGDYKIEIKWKDDKFNINRYKIAAKKFIGRHNFENFAKGKVKNAYCIIRKFEIEEAEKFWINRIEGNRFLYEMIRKIISFLVSVGKNRFPLDKIDLILDKAKLDPKPPSAPPEYLILKRVYIDWQRLYKYIEKVIL